MGDLIIIKSIGKQIVLFLSFLFVLSACVTPQPHHIDNICKIFRQYPKWYWATRDAKGRWGVPISVQMAFIYQESGFRGDVKPARTKLLWVIPWKRPSSSYGYTQALRVTWARYKRSVGRHWVSRDKFSDAVDFIGWYAHKARHYTGVSSHDPYRLYLVYHEGFSGYKKHSYARKKWLLKVARRVAYRARLYQRQLRTCQADLQHHAWYKFW